MKIITTKTTYRIADLTAELVQKSLVTPFSRCFVFCEDKNTLSLETAIANRTGSFNVNVMSFSRYISSRQSGLCLSKTGSTLTVFKIINQLEKELVRLKTSNRPTLAKNIFEIIALLKSAKIKPTELLEICQKEQNGAFGSKLFDIYKIYDEYEKQLVTEQLLDSGNFLGLMPELAKSDTKLCGAKVIFAGFSALTKQIKEIFVSLSKICDCDFVVLKGDGEFYTNEIFERVSEFFPNAEIYEDKFEYCQEIKSIEKSLFSLSNKEVGLYSDKVRVFELDTPYFEVQNIAKRIRLEIVKNNRRYKDFAIAVGNIKEYGRIITDIFKEYEIPVFIDSQTTLDIHPLSNLIVDILDAVRLNFSVESVIKLSKHQLICEQEQAICFSNYIAENAIYGSSLRSPFQIKSEADRNAEAVRNRIFDVCMPFKAKLSAFEFCKTLDEIFISQGIYERAEQLTAQLNENNEIVLADFNEKAIKKVKQLLEEISKIILDKPLTVAEFKNIFVVASASSEVSVLPLFNDVVYVGDFKSVKQRSVKWLFMAGMTSDVPGAKQDTALLNDRDLIKMEGYELIIEPKIKVVNLRERENVGVCAMSFLEKLYISYPRQDTTGQIVSKSSIIDFILKAFNLYAINADEAKQGFNYDSSKDIYGYMTKASALKQFALDVNSFKERQSDKLLPMNSFYQVGALKYPQEMQKLLGELDREVFSKPVVEKLSASVIETYFDCPYSCFAKHNLKLKEEETGEANAMEYGVFIHSVFEKVISNYAKLTGEKDCEHLTTKYYDELLTEPIYSRYFNKPKYKYMFDLVKKECIKAVKDIYTEYQNSSFKPIGQEVSFGNLHGAKLPAIKIETKDGKILEISGKVDRIDGFDKYIRIIDYKTGNPEEISKDYNLYYGNDIQLYLYPNAFINEDNQLAGVYYYKVNDNYVDKGKHKQVYFGNTLSDVNIIESMDYRLKTELVSKPFNFTYKVKKDNSRSLSSSSSLISTTHMKAFVDYAKAISTACANELNEGNIVTSPCGTETSNTCEYCQFGGLCGYDAEVDNLLRKTHTIEKEQIASALEEKND